MTGYKSVLASKTFWGSIIAALGVIVPKIAGLDLNSIWPVATVIAGAVMSIVGRFTAKKKVTLTGSSPSA
jgi:VIT1/CCC1 family predicted Fe2+/Mn2+ transporter